MELKYNGKIIPLARELRKNMTKEERHLWYDFLREYPVKFTRQKAIDNYIVDFYCSKAKLVIELDGSQHFEENVMKYDSDRTSYLEKYGLLVVRINNNDVNMKFKDVCAYIDDIVRKRVGF